MYKCNVFCCMCTVVLHAIKSMDFYSRILFRISFFKFTFLELSSHTARCDKIAITKICVAEHTEIQHAWRQIYIEKVKKKRNDRKKHEVTPTITAIREIPKTNAYRICKVHINTYQPWSYVEIKIQNRQNKIKLTKKKTFE